MGSCSIECHSSNFFVGVFPIEHEKILSDTDTISKRKIIKAKKVIHSLLKITFYNFETLFLLNYGRYKLKTLLQLHFRIKYKKKKKRKIK